MSNHLIVSGQTNVDAYKWTDAMCFTLENQPLHLKMIIWL